MPGGGLYVAGHGYEAPRVAAVRGVSPSLRGSLSVFLTGPVPGGGRPAAAVSCVAGAEEGPLPHALQVARRGSRCSTSGSFFSLAA